MSDAVSKTTTEPDIVIDIRGDVSGMVAAGENIYQHQTNVSDGGLAYVLEEGVVPFRKAKRPIRLLSRADPPLLDREDETAEALGAVRPGGTIQVTGGPGSGKSLFLTHLAYGEMPVTLEDGVVHLRARGQPLYDLSFRLFYAFHDSLLPTAYVPPPPQIRREMAGITATILIDDVDDLGTDIDGLLDMAIDSGFVLSSRTEVVDGSAEVALGGLPTPEAVDLFARTYRGSLRDRPGVAELCAVLDGHPQCVVFAARLVDAEGLDPAALASELSGPDPCHQVAKRLLAALPESEARVAAFLAALEGAPVPVEQATAATAVSRTAEVLRELAGAGIAPSNSPRYAFNPMLQDAAEELWDLDELRVTAVDQLTGWLGQRSPEDPSVIETAPMVLHLMDWAAGTGRHHETVALGEGIDGALALSGHWGSWERVHEIVLGSASDAGDAAAQGWALHQMGTKALCWGERSVAESLLGEALGIRVQVGVQSAIDTTQHNLDVLHPPPAGVAGEGDTPPGGGGGGIAAIAKGLGIVLVAGAVAVAGWLLFGPGADGDGGTTFSTSDGGVTEPASDGGVTEPASDGGVTEPASDGGLTGILGSDPPQIEFPGVIEGSAERRDIVVRNFGDQSLQIEDPLIVEGDEFQVIGENCAGVELGEGEACFVSVLFQAPERGTYEGALVIFNTGDPASLEIPLFGQSLAPGGLVPDPFAIEFGTIDTNETGLRTVVLHNPGDLPVTFEAGFDIGAPFGVAETTCPLELEGHADCLIDVEFDPTQTRDYADVLVVSHSGDGSPLLIDLSGSGVRIIN